LLSHPYKCPLRQPFSFDNHTNARGVWGPTTFLSAPGSTIIGDPSLISPSAATLMDIPASVANKQLTEKLNPLDATLTEKMEVGHRHHRKVAGIYPLVEECQPCLK
jgi:hypothetical protein